MPIFKKSPQEFAHSNYPAERSRIKTWYILKVASIQITPALGDQKLHMGSRYLGLTHRKGGNKVVSQAPKTQGPRAHGPKGRRDPRANEPQRLGTKGPEPQGPTRGSHGNSPCDPRAPIHGILRQAISYVLVLIFIKLYIMF